MTQEQKWLLYVAELREKHDKATVHFKAYILNELKVKLSEAKKLECGTDFIDGYQTAIQDLGVFIEEYPVLSADRL